MGANSPSKLKQATDFTIADLHSKEFNERYYYDGPLGLDYKPWKSTFNLWAPTALTVDLILFDEEGQKELKRYPMTRKDKGVFRLELKGDFKGRTYLYRLTFADGTETDSVDPYATAVTMNGEKTVILDATKIHPKNWKRMPPFTKPTDAVIYEVHIRDLSIAENAHIKHAGKFLGVVEPGTKTNDGYSTGLDYLTELGISHIQFLPMADYATVDESGYDPSDYNWGYDPQNYNVPEGSYSTDASNPESRILEMKTMIQGLHHRGIRVIMDVVYNHVYIPRKHALEKTVPGYYFRYNDEGQLSNGTMVGNDTASEQLMMRRYMIESVRYWTETYHIDGFRFDLMGIHDVETIKLIRQTLDEIDPSIIMTGEGWDMPTELDFSQRASYRHADQLGRVAHFNDQIRDSIKGSDYGDGRDKGFITGKYMVEKWLLQNMMGGIDFPRNIASYTKPEQVLQYVEAHDNYTLNDRVKMTLPKVSSRERHRRVQLGTAIILLSQGIPFIHAGQEFFRTKQGIRDSYNYPDHINALNWEQRETYEEEIEFVRQLIQFRKDHPVLRLNDYEEIRQSVQVLKDDYQIIGIKYFEEDCNIILIFNAQENIIDFPLEIDNYEVVAEDFEFFKPGQNILRDVRNIRVAPLSVTILKKNKIKN